MLTVITFSLVPFTFSHVPSDEEQSVTVAVVLTFIYAPRTWCPFCPMGTLSSWVAPKSGHLPDGYRGIKVGDNCTKKCKMCARVCPMQLNTYEARGNGEGFNHPDCIKCGKCTLACPMRACFHQYFPRLTDNLFSSGCRFHHLVGAVKDAHIKFFLQLCKHCTERRLGDITRISRPRKAAKTVDCYDVLELLNIHH